LKRIKFVLARSDDTDSLMSQHKAINEQISKDSKSVLILRTIDKSHVGRAMYASVHGNELKIMAEVIDDLEVCRLSLFMANNPDEIPAY
jgi:hypothetical protein